MITIPIDGKSIQSWDDFHDAFQQKLGFPTWYGRNMDAWIDCMKSMDRPEEGLTKTRSQRGEWVLIQVTQTARMPKQVLQSLLECAAFVNGSRIAAGESPILAIACSD